MTLDRSGGKGRVITGARSRFLLNGKKIGYAKGVNLSETINYEAVEVLDNIEDEEHTPVSYKVTFSASMFRIISATLKSAGLMPSNGANSDEHLLNILTSGEMTAQIEDTKTHKIYSEVSGVKIASHNWSVDARGLVGEDVEFVAIRVSDESELA